MDNNIDLSKDRYKELLEKFEAQITPLEILDEAYLDDVLAAHLGAGDSNYILVLCSIWIKNKKDFADIEKQVREKFGFKKLRLVQLKDTNELGSYEEKYSFKQENKYGLHVDTDYEPEHEHFVCLFQVGD